MSFQLKDLPSLVAHAVPSLFDPLYWLFFAVFVIFVLWIWIYAEQRASKRLRERIHLAERERDGALRSLKAHHAWRIELVESLNGRLASVERTCKRVEEKIRE